MTEVSPEAGLGRRFQPDARNRNFPLPRRAITKQLRRRQWNCPSILDQGSTPHCVGYTGFNWLCSGPITNRQVNFSPSDLYRWAQERDEWEGTNYDGTSGLGLMKALKDKGYITEYRWAFDVETIFGWLLNEGPLCMGTLWYLDMFTPGADGFLYVGGDDVGGHEYLLVGCDVEKKCPDKSVGAVRIVNSWGRGWGQNGRAWLSRENLSLLLHREGDCCTATEIKL